MLIDVSYRLARKALPPGLFNFAARLFGRHRGYYRPETYRAIYEYYRSRG